VPNYFFKLWPPSKDFINHSTRILTTASARVQLEDNEDGDMFVSRFVLKEGEFVQQL
jgi:hypothetical protein